MPVIVVFFLERMKKRNLTEGIRPEIFMDKISREASSSLNEKSFPAKIS